MVGCHACVYTLHCGFRLRYTKHGVFLLQAGWKIDMSVKLHRWESSANAMQ